MCRHTTNQPALIVDSDPHEPGSRCVSVRNLHPDLIASLGSQEVGHLLPSVFRVRVVRPDAPGDEDLPDVLGHHEVLESGVRFIPYLPFDSGIRFRAIFDPGPLGDPQFSEVLTLEFSLSRAVSTVRTQVKQVFPSSDSLPENLLRFYVCFSNPMQRGRSEEQIRLLGPDGRPAPDTLYRPPVELWDRTMRHLTILLDPGRLKRRVGPNRELGPPLKAGQKYTLAIGPGMIDFSGCSLGESSNKSFRVIEAIREPIAIQQWTIQPPPAKSREPLVIMFPTPLDWAMLWRAITIAPEGGHPINGRITIGADESRWSFTPTGPWSEGSYYIRIAPDLEDICGNNLSGAFDRPLRSDSNPVNDVADRSIPFHVE